ncbi:MAG: hydroxypyruvate isomerase family protein [Proteobacteria bacterium]|nr:hydroxypyruvate isomerase family protein [Pseudomonadota bacterium]
MPKFAANLSMLFGEAPFLDRFAAAQAAGFKGVEFLFPYGFPKDEIAGALKGAGLAQALFNAPPGDWDKGERGLAALPDRVSEFRAGIETALEYAKALSCPTVHVMGGIQPKNVTPETVRKTYVDNLRHACDRAAEQGIMIVIEPLNDRDVPGYVLPRVGDAARLIDSVERPNLGIQFDFYHVQIMDGDLAKRFEAHFAQVGHIQIAGVPERHEPDVGEICYPYLFDLIDRMGYVGWVGCEYRPKSTTVAGLDWLFS